MWAAWAQSAPVSSKMAQEKSSRSLILGEKAALRRTAPISSHTAERRLEKRPRETGSNRSAAVFMRELSHPRAGKTGGHRQRPRHAVPPLSISRMIPVSSCAPGRGGRAVECNGLENRRGLTPSVGSNPTLSAIVSWPNRRRPVTCGPAMDETQRARGPFTRSNRFWRGAGAGRTGLTRNQVIPHGIRGFESHPLRHFPP